MFAAPQQTAAIKVSVLGATAFANTFLSHSGQKLSAVRLAADIMGVSRKHSSVLSSIVPPRPRSRHSVSEPGSMSRSEMEVDASWLPPARNANTRVKHRHSSISRNSHRDTKSFFSFTAADGDSAAVGADRLGVQHLLCNGGEKFIRPSGPPWLCSPAFTRLAGITDP